LARVGRRAFLADPAAPAGLDPTGAILGPAFFDRDTVAVARDLLGKVLVREFDGVRLWGRLVEVEAYMGPDDLAAHSVGGRRTPRTEVMFGPPGHAYVYLTYGMHHCLNFVTRSEGIPQAVLVRAIEPGPGVGRAGGPGLVCRALDIDRRLNGIALIPPQLYVLDDHAPRRRIHVTPRIGVENSGDWAGRPLRFCLDSPYLSRRLKKVSIRASRQETAPRA
jgi:DNA-3-methyladenine glycosylase